MSDDVFHELAFAELIDRRSFERRNMEEQIGPPIPFDEPEAAIQNQLLDSTLWHYCSPT
jgi:hypothetical protein